MQNLDSLSYEELLKLRDQIVRDNSQMKDDISRLEISIQNTSRENEKQEEKLMNNYQQKIDYLRHQNVVTAQKIHKEEQYIINTLYEKYKIVLKEKEALQEKLQEEESMVIEKLQFELDKMKKIEILLEAKLSQCETNHASSNCDLINPVLTGKLSEELEQMYQQSVKTKDDYSNELVKLRQEIERLITANNLLIQRISTTQMSLVLNHGNNINEERMPAFGKNIGKMRRFSDISGGIRHKKRRVSQPQ
ncbi:hypothetical protein TRFO_13690 [Tritrichomonas foetus]|uniref:Uncharacterized protein n=1 Tax=Tritrichomonas foetus TaxID=1144522 RepID=A0A1J4L1N2_9EUKA|nr:hypothetical protein TRFO_13690 [Tritrichomonas foetus]|eukprot:OHT15862.1 hypothetical protein TRFO_13690 [Tritrichomonas foetus]